MPILSMNVLNSVHVQLMHIWVDGLDCLSKEGGDPPPGEVHQLVLHFITSYRTIISLTTTPCSEHQTKCCSNRSELGMFVIRR